MDLLRTVNIILNFFFSYFIRYAVPTIKEITDFGKTPEKSISSGSLFGARGGG